MVAVRYMPGNCIGNGQDKLYFCGTETAQMAGGYLDGALEASDGFSQH